MLGTVRDDLGLELRSVSLRSYLIFFRYLDDRLEVVRIVHGARDLPTVFESED